MHAEGAHAHPSVRLVAVAAPSPANRTRIAERFAATPYESLDHMLQSESLDCICVASPDQTHIGHVEAALAAGLHVFAEKPLGYSRCDAEAIAKSAETSQRFVAVNYNRRHSFGYRTAQRILNEGYCGEVRQIWIQVTDGTPPPHVALREDVVHWTLLGHHYDLIRWLGGPVASIWATTTPVRTAGVVADLAVIFRMKSGAAATLNVSYRDGQQRTTERCEIVGEHGGLVVEDVSRRVIRFQSDPDHREIFQANPFTQGDQFYVSLRDHLDAFFTRLAAGLAPEISVEDAIHANALADAVILSINTSREVAVDAAGE